MKWDLVHFCLRAKFCNLPFQKNPALAAGFFYACIKFRLAVVGWVKPIFRLQIFTFLLGCTWSLDVAVSADRVPLSGDTLMLI